MSDRAALPPDRRIIGSNLRALREASGHTRESLAALCGLRVERVTDLERGRPDHSLDVFLRLAAALDVAPARIFSGLRDEQSPRLPPTLGVVPTSSGLKLRFPYDQFDAEYELPSSSLAEYHSIISLLRSCLMSGTPAQGIAETFLTAVKTWPQANPSDIWTFVIARAYCDRSIHPSTNQRLNLEQSWKRASGWALERVMVDHYASALRQSGIEVKIAKKSEATQFLSHIRDPRLIPDKVDALLVNRRVVPARPLGVVHVKASLAERRTNDVPMSRALMAAGLLSVFWTLDIKSFPSERPFNRGELGDAGEHRTNEKRRDFEVNRNFSACFSYNQNTIPTPHDARTTSKIFVCDFAQTTDAFVRFLTRALDVSILAKERRSLSGL